MGNRALWGFVFLLFVLQVAGCGGGTNPPTIAKKERQPSVEKKKADPAKAPGQKEPEQKAVKEYVYDPSGKPDPFKPFIQLASTRESSRRAPLTPLQKYEIGQLKLVAIITAPEGNSIALVEDSAGKGYFLKKGTWVGSNDGKVTKILKDQVIIEETYQDIFGKNKTNEISLSLHRTEEGNEP
jgi:Tfp pilus assembly protein PilP